MMILQFSYLVAALSLLLIEHPNILIEWSYILLRCNNQIHEEHPDNIESLQYLEALCKDLGRPHEEYTRKLDKLRRALPATTQQGK